MKEWTNMAEEVLLEAGKPAHDEAGAQCPFPFTLFPTL